MNNSTEIVKQPRTKEKKKKFFFRDTSTRLDFFNHFSFNCGSLDCFDEPKNAWSIGWQAFFRITTLFLKNDSK